MKVVLSRNDGGLKWGFRLKGGKDFGHPLTAESISAGQIASNCGLINGDFITKINGQSTQYMKHHEAQSLIRESGNEIQFDISRGGLYPQFSPSASSEHLAGDSGDVFDEEHKSPIGSEPRNLPNYRRPSLPMPSPFQLQESKAPQSITFENKKTDINTGQFKSLTKESGAAGFVPNSSVNNNFNTKSSPKTLIPEKRCEDKPPPSSVATTGGSKQMPQQQQQQVNNSAENKGKIPGLSDKIKDFQSKSAVGKQSCCKICRQLIQGAFYSTDSGVYCKDHFKCSACCLSLINSEFMEKDGFLWCKEDYVKRFAEVCGQCGQAISGSMVSALGKQWHSRCFNCCNCHQQIVSSSFRVNDDNKPVCDTCWTKNFQKKCSRCKKAIDGIDWYQEANGKQYHSSCFVCSICSEALKSKVYVSTIGHLLCEKHANV